jgi:hypothetical protein
MKAREAKQAREAPEKKNDHAVDALRYLVCSRPENEWASSDVPHSEPRTTSHTVPRNEDYSYAEEFDRGDKLYHPVLGEEDSW